MDRKKQQDAQKETAGQIPLKLDELTRNISKVTASPNDNVAEYLWNQ
jgi:hypothetical protein